jgi:hypothetical protein
MKMIWSQIKENHQGVALAVGVTILVLGWRLVVLWHEQAHWRCLAAECGSVPQFTQNLYASHAGSVLVYGQHVENNTALYLCDLRARKTRRLTEMLPKFCGWSPDDSRLAFVAPQPKNPGKSEIVICDGRSGERQAELGDPGIQQPGDFTWLSANAFAYCTGTNIGLAEQRGNGTWLRAKNFPVVVTNHACFSACSPDSVVWQNGNKIETLNFTTGVIREEWNSSSNRLEDFICSPQGSELLLKCRDADGQYLLRYSLASKRTLQAGRIDRNHAGNFRTFSRWVDDSLTYIAWEAESVRTVFLSDDGLNTFHLGAPVTPSEQTLEWCGGVMAHTCAVAGHLFIAGHPTNELMGIWDYDFKRRKLENVVPNFEGGFRHAHYVPPTYGVLTNSSGKLKGYSVWEPRQKKAGQKYPLILTQTVNGEWLPIEQTAANCNCFFAVVHRPYWLGRGLSEWGDDVSRLREILLHNPNIDTNRIVLWGHSAEIGPEFQLLQANPSLWAGAIFSAVTGLPEPAGLGNKKLFVIAGKNSGATGKIWEWQKRAWAVGAQAKVFIQENVGHNPQTLATVRERTEIFAQIICEDL